MLNGANNYHSKMTKKILNAKKEFFDRNPSGRILNRFSADIGCIDFALINCAWVLI